MMLKRLSALSGLVLFAAALIAPQAKSDEWDKKTVVTVNETMMIPGATLQPGKYVFKLADSMANRHIVQVFNEDQSHILATILAIPNERLEPKGETVLELWETPKGAPKALRAWFYPGDSMGQEFRYPKDEAASLTAEVHQEVPALSDEDQAALAKHGSDMASSEASSTEPSKSEQQPASTTTTTDTNENSRELAHNDSAEPAPAAAPSSTDQQPQVQSQESQSADNRTQSDVQEQHPMTSSSTSTESDSSSKSASRSELPRTASYLPLLGLAGLVALGAATIVRISSIR